MRTKIRCAVSMLFEFDKLIVAYAGINFESFNRTSVPAG